jgi:ribose-phosphate pyrophosphokinase
MEPLFHLFTGTASEALAHKISVHCGYPLGKVQLQRFTDGELRPLLNRNVQDAHVCLIQATHPPAEHMMELLLTIDAAKQAGARCVTVVVPYLGYMRQDALHHPGGPIGARLQANLLAAAGADRLMTCDLHAQHIMGFFTFPVEQLSSLPVFVPYITHLKLPRLTFVAPDRGGVARAQRYATHFDAPLLLCTKQKQQPQGVMTVAVQGDVEGMDAVIIDDIVDTGGTICQAAAQLKAEGARTVRTCCTHPLLSGDAYQRLEASVLEEVVVTDTIPLRHVSAKLRVCSVAAVFGDALRQVQMGP